MEQTTLTIDCPSLGARVTGALDDSTGVVSFRGIPYADLGQRWSHSTPKDSLPSDMFDATSYGSRCPQADGLVLVSGGLNDPTPGDDEFACLNLNVAVRVVDVKAGGKLPVMVWIHGGAFLYGANSVARYRPERYLAEAAQMDSPVVLVQINYRLGALGFAASQDLNTVTGDCGGQYGFVDQRNALQWVQRHIACFGGDPANVTAFGVSAGSVSVHAHIVSGDPLFDRGIMMSGTLGAILPLPRSFYQHAWDSLLEKSGLADHAPADRIAKLRNLDASKLVDMYSKSALGPHGSHEPDGLLPVVWSDTSETRSSRCKSVIIGDTHVEAVIMGGLIDSLPFERLQELAFKHFGDLTADFLDAFGLSRASSPAQYREAMYVLLSATMFQYPGVLAAKSFANVGTSYLYHFEEPSPFKGPTYGRSYHGQCALYLHLNESEAVPEGGVRTSKEMVQKWTAFAYGRQSELWQPINASDGDPSFMKFGPGGESGMYTCSSDSDRSYHHIPWLKEQWGSTQLFVQGLLHTK